MAPSRSKLEDLIAKAKADSDHLYSEVERAKSAKLKISLLPLQKRAFAAQKKHFYLSGLLKLSEAMMLQRLQSSREERAYANQIKDRSPGKARNIFSRIRETEKSYLLWCDHHKRTPTEVQQPPKAKTPPKKENLSRPGRGGARPGSGRPALHHVQLLFKCTPKTAEKVRQLAKAHGWSTTIIPTHRRQLKIPTLSGREFILKYGGSFMETFPPWNGVFCRASGKDGMERREGFGDSIIPWFSPSLFASGCSLH